MRYNNALSIILIVIIVVNLLFAISSINEPLQKKVTSSAVGNVNLIVGETAVSPPPQPQEPTGNAHSELEEELKSKILVDTQTLKIALKIGESFGTEIKITNIGNEPALLSIDLFKNFNLLTGFAVSDNPIELIISPKSLIINPQETKIIKLTFVTKENTPPGIYTGKLTIKGEDIEEFVNLIIEVESKKIIFDSILDIPFNYKEVFAGSEIIVNPTFINLADVPRSEVKVIYSILDFDGNIILQTSENIFLEKQTTISKKLKLPENLRKGKYIISVYLKYKDSFAVSSNTFEVIEQHKLEAQYNFNLVLGGSIFFIFILGIAIILYIQRRNVQHIERQIRKNAYEIKKQY